jgi:hypothetical protein
MTNPVQPSSSNRPTSRAGEHARQEGRPVAAGQDAGEIDRGRQRQREVDSHEHERRGQQRHRVPAHGHPPPKQPGQQNAIAGLSIDQAGQQQAGHKEAGIQRQDGEGEQPCELLRGGRNAARSADDQEQAAPGEGERQDVVAQDRVALDERRGRHRRDGQFRRRGRFRWWSGDHPGAHGSLVRGAHPCLGALGRGGGASRAQG